MKMNKKITILLFLFVFVVSSFAQIIQRGDPTARRTGIHRGNQVRTIFGNWGVVAQPGDQGPRLAWKYDADGYCGDVSPLVGLRLPIADYNKDTKPDTLYEVVITPVSRPGGGSYAPGGGQSWTFEPIPGFFNPTINEAGKGVAMSHQPETWPGRWPDQPTWNDENGKAEWNGYFGRGQFNADQESYYWMDDQQDEKMFSRWGFLPDPSDPTRKGYGLRVASRGLQWGNFLAQDVLFQLFDVQNIGKINYEQVVFGTLVGTYVGGSGDEWDDDVSFFQVRDAITYSWDFDKYIRPSANAKWEPNPSTVGYLFYAFLESPGNSVNGIDDDGDDKTSGTAAYFTENDFKPRTLKAGDKLILIDPSTYARTSMTMPASATVIKSLGRSFRVVPDSTILAEGNMVLGSTGFVLNKNAYDGLDNDFDGIIDENYQLHYRQFKQDQNGKTLIDTLNAVQYKDYVKNIGINDKMLDESREDGIDNDGDWNIETDDVGQDGKAGTKDVGEGDGRPTVGEPNFDKTDVHESDQIGLTSFQYFVPAGDIKMADENDMWKRLKPGLFEVPGSIVNNIAIRGEDGDFAYGSGYFPLRAGEIQRFSLGLGFGDDLRGAIKTKRIAQLIYNANYNFPQPPTKPTVTAVPGNKKVTLYWDDAAEKSVDKVTKEKDFEGYMIYKGTDPDFIDSYTISDGNGVARRYKPVAQYDLKNGVRGFFPVSSTLIEQTNGVPFNLGNDSGVQNFFEDTDVINGRRYYYAVVAYDHGDASKDIYPSENTKFIAKDIANVITTDANTVTVVPNPPVLGYVPPTSGVKLTRTAGASNSIPYFEVRNDARVISAQYEISLVDSLVKGSPIAYGFTAKNTITGENLFAKPQPLRDKNGVVFNGVSLSFDLNYQKLDSIKINPALSGWNKPGRNLSYIATPVSLSGYPAGVRDARDYAIVFSTKYDKKSTADLLTLPVPERQGNFQVLDVTTKSNPQLVPFAWITADSLLNNGDRLFLSDTKASKLTWAISILGDSVRIPTAGDTLKLSFNKPLTSLDKFTFKTVPAGTNSDSIKANLSRVKVVPNPYVATNVFEQPLPTQIRGRGDRVINFMNLPAGAKISIYTSSGSLIRDLQQDGNLQNGTVSWDVRTSEGLDVAFGVYFYVVEVPLTGDKKFGKIAIVK